MTRCVWRLLLLFVGVMALGVAPVTAQFETIIDDDLNTDTSSDYTIVNGGHGPGDGSVAFGFDYSTIMVNGSPIPAAPGTTDGSTNGVRVTVNETANSPGLESEAYTIFHNTEVTGFTDYTMTVDVFMGVWSPADEGSTEHAHIGVGGDGSTLNQLFQASPFTVSGSGHYVVLSGDGADSSDYRHWRDDANGSGSPGPVNQFDPDYLSPDSGTNVTSDNFIGFFEEVSNINAPIPGVIGNAWATVKVEVLQSEGLIKYFVRGATADTTGDPTIFPAEEPEFLQIIESELFDQEGFVSFGLGDLYNSVATEPDGQFAIFDNLFVEGIAGMSDINGDFNDDGIYDCLDVDALVVEIVGGTNNGDFDLDGSGAVDGDDLTAWLAEAGAANLASGNSYLVGDANLDGSVDVSDFNVWNSSKFTNTPAWCSGDFNADGVIDVSDFNLWNGNKFNSADGAAAVPEPAAGLLLLLGMAALFGKRR